VAAVTHGIADDFARNHADIEAVTLGAGARSDHGCRLSDTLPVLTQRNKCESEEGEMRRKDASYHKRCPSARRQASTPSGTQRHRDAETHGEFLFERRPQVNCLCAPLCLCASVFLSAPSAPFLKPDA
jgi:hypothetical protein